MDNKKEFIFLAIFLGLYFLGVLINFFSAGIGGALIALFLPPLAILIALAWLGVTFFTLLCLVLGLY